MQTGLAFTSTFRSMKFLSGVYYFCAFSIFICIGVFLINESRKRCMCLRKAIAGLREKEAKLGFDIGTIK